VLWLSAIAVLLMPPCLLAAPDGENGASAPNLENAVQGTLTPVVGRHVQDPEGSDVGRVWDVLVDAQGIPRAAVIEYGGALGFGKRKVAVAWSALKFGMSHSSDDVILALTRTQLGSVPDFKYGAGDATIGRVGGAK